MASRQQDENYSSDGAIFKRDTCNVKEATIADGMCHLDASATVTAPTIAGLSGIRARPAPATLINRLGQPHFGYFAESVAQFSLPQFVYRTEMDSPASAWARYFHYKQFQFVALQGADFLLGMALADIRYLGSGFVYLYDMNTNHLTELNFLQPLGGRYATSPSPVNGHGYIRARQGQLALTLSQGCWQIQVDTPFARGEFSLLPSQSARSDTARPLVVCSPTGYSGWTYTQKHNGLALDGQLQLQGGEVDLTTVRGGYDFSAGYMRRETSWRWASINGSCHGISVGLNLAAGVNETGLSENACWVNGVCMYLPPVHFAFKRDDPDAPWHIYSDDGRIDLHFMPRNCRRERRNLWLLKSNFRQFIGHFHGSVVLDNGQRLALSQVPGLTEDHFAKW